MSPAPSPIKKVEAATKELWKIWYRPREDEVLFSELNAILDLAGKPGNYRSPADGALVWDLRSAVATLKFDYEYMRKCSKTALKIYDATKHPHIPMNHSSCLEYFGLFGESLENMNKYFGRHNFPDLKYLHRSAIVLACMGRLAQSIRNIEEAQRHYEAADYWTSKRDELKLLFIAHKILEDHGITDDVATKVFNIAFKVMRDAGYLARGGVSIRTFTKDSDPYVQWRFAIDAPFEKISRLNENLADALAEHFIDVENGGLILHVVDFGYSNQIIRKVRDDT